MADLKFENYRCLVCSAISRVRFFAYEFTPPILNCWQCGAGRGIPDMGEMLKARRGMVTAEVAKQMGVPGPPVAGPDGEDVEVRN